MCGLAGIATLDPRRVVDTAPLWDMEQTIAHRGPDDSGVWSSPGVGLASARLAILDLSSRGHMPMASADHRYRIVYNGEIYNCRELRAELQEEGCRFYSSSDTEVLLNLYAKHGIRMLNRLNGMFAFAVWDLVDRSLFVARDRLGVKPLYYALRPEALVFASEQKALFAAGVDRVFDPSTWEELLCFRYVAGARTPYRGVQRLPAGHYLQWRHGDLRIRRWWNLGERMTACRESGRDASAWYAATFDDSVRLRMLSDVPVGVLLSGGLDSSSVALSAARQAPSALSSFTVRVDFPGRDEGPVANEVAHAGGLTSHELRLTPDDLREGLLSASELSDEPLAHASDVHLLAIAKYAKSRVTVLLSGEGGDETLGGYVRYRPLRYPQLLPVARLAAHSLRGTVPPGSRLAKLGRFLSLATTREFVLMNACEVLPSDLDRVGFQATGVFPFRESVLTEAEQLFPHEPMRQAMYSDQQTFLASLLHRNDRMTMGASIECRVPFLDYRLVEGTAALPTSKLLPGLQSKPLLRKSLGGRLPKIVRTQSKWGFGVPWAHYLRTVPALRECVRELPQSELLQDGSFDLARVRTIIDDFLGGDRVASALVTQLVMITSWHRACFSRPAVRKSCHPIC